MLCLEHLFRTTRRDFCHDLFKSTAILWKYHQQTFTRIIYFLCSLSIPPSIMIIIGVALEYLFGHDSIPHFCRVSFTVHGNVTGLSQAGLKNKWSQTSQTCYSGDFCFSSGPKWNIKHAGKYLLDMNTHRENTTLHP